ncbi:LamG-like jellyroll fold domain-containing protein [Streptacidiphilus sp. PAMC 29251]
MHRPQPLPGTRPVLAHHHPDRRTRQRVPAAERLRGPDHHGERKTLALPGRQRCHPGRRDPAGRRRLVPDDPDHPGHRGRSDHPVGARQHLRRGVRLPAAAVPGDAHLGLRASDGAAAAARAQARRPLVSSVAVSPQQCLDDSGSSITAGGKVDVYPCSNTAAQNWVLGTDGTVRAMGMCLDAWLSGTANNTKVDEYTCNGTGAQQWKAGPNGQLINTESGRCLADHGSVTTPGTQVVLWDCTNGLDENWNNGATTALAGSNQQPVGYVDPAAYPIVTSPGDVTGGPNGTRDGKPDLYLLNSTGTVTVDSGITSPGAQINTQDPVGIGRNQWALNEGTGAKTANDTGSASIDSAAHATYNGTAVTWSNDTTLTAADTNNAKANPTGTTPTFNGTNYLAVPGADRLNTAASYTVSAWVKLSADDGDDQWAVTQSTPNSQAFFLGYEEPTKTWSFTTTTSATNPSYPSADSALGAATLNQWTHLVGVYDIDGTMALYVNGQLAATATNTTPVFDQNGSIAIGDASFPTATTAYQGFHGSISDVRLYQTAFGPETALAAPLAYGTVAADTAASQQLDNTVPNPAPAALDRDTWPLQGPDTTGAAGDTGNENKATGPSAATILQPNTPAAFNGSNYLTTQAPALDPTKSFSLSVQATQDPAGPAATTDVMCQGTGTNNGFCLGDTGPGTPWFFQLSDSATPTSPPTVTNSTMWSLNGNTEPEYGADGATDTLTAVYDASATPHTMTLYVNGCPAGSHTVTQPNIDYTAPLILGAANTSTTNPFTGQISTLQVYPYALASTELPGGGCTPKGLPIIGDISQIPDGTIVHSANHPGLLIVEDSFGFPIADSDTTTDNYDTSTVQAVTDDVYLGLTQTYASDQTTLIPKLLGDGTLVTDASGTDPNTYTTVGGALVPITPADQAIGTYPGTPIPVPTSWITAQTAAKPADDSLVNDATTTGADPNTYVIIQGVAAPVTSADEDSLGLDPDNSVPVPASWIAKEASNTPPAGTLFFDFTTSAYDVYTNPGIHQLTDDEMSSGTPDLSTAILAPDSLITKLAGTGS